MMRLDWFSDLPLHFVLDSNADDDGNFRISFKYVNMILRQNVTIGEALPMSHY